MLSNVQEDSKRERRRVSGNKQKTKNKASTSINKGIQKKTESIGQDRI